MRLCLLSVIAPLVVAGCTSKYVVVAEPGQDSAVAAEGSIGRALTTLNFTEDQNALQTLGNPITDVGVWREHSKPEKDGQLLAFISNENGNAVLKLVPQTYGTEHKAEARAKQIAENVESALRDAGITAKICEERGLDLR